MNALQENVNEWPFFFSPSGDKIDTKQCETFEEILRRVQFKNIDLESCHLDDEVPF